MKLLPTYEVRADIFDKILYDLSGHIEYEADLQKWSYGYKNKHTIYYNEEYLICKECVLDYYCDCLSDSTNWKQCKLRKVLNAEKPVQKTITGNYAWNYITKILTKYYSLDEIDDILLSHEADYSEEFRQYHYNLPIEPGYLVKYSNCFKYDINGAHCDAIVQLFPKAYNEFIKLYQKRHEIAMYKQLFNFFVGELCRKTSNKKLSLGFTSTESTYRKTYNWIVQRTTKKLNEAMDRTNGILIYANTDGFIVQQPEVTLTCSKELFDFKQEYSGDVYVYRSNNYILYQCGDSMTGSCRCEVRENIDLRVGKVVNYKVVKEYLGTDANGKKRYRNLIVDKEYKEGVEIYEA